MALFQWGRRPPRRLLLWLAGNVLVLAGVFALLYAGGMLVYPLGRTMLSAAVPDTPPVRQAPALVLTAVPTPPLPLLNWQQAAPPALPVDDPVWRSSITRLVIPAISLDSPVVPVGWKVQEVNGQTVAVWEVARYAVGHHFGSANPDEGSNIVLAGHSGGFGAVFRRLLELQPGDEVVLYGAGRQHLYVVEEILLLPEIGIPFEERLHNAVYMNPTDEERVTMITCWPVRVYDHRVIVLARPYRAVPFPRPDLVEN